MLRIARHATTFSSLLALAFLSLATLLNAWSLSAIVRGHAQADHCSQALASVERVLSLLKDAETGQRGFLLTGRETYLESYHLALAGIDPELRRLRSIILVDGHQERFEVLAGLVAGKLAELAETVDFRRRGEFDAAMKVVLSDRGRDLMLRVGSVAEEIRTQEEGLLEARLVVSRSAVRGAMATFGMTTVTALVLLGGLSFVERRSARQRAISAAAIQTGEAWLAATLSSIGDAVIATDEHGQVRFLNPIAEAITGWTSADAAGRSMAEVFPIINETTRLPVDDPVAKVLREGNVVGLANHTLLIRRDGVETPIDDSAAPIKDAEGRVTGVVLVFRDISDRKHQEAVLKEQCQLAEFGRDIGLVLSEGADLVTMTRRCVEQTVHHLDAALARIWAVDDSGEVLELQASAGLYTHTDGPHGRVPVGRYKIGKIAQDRIPHLTNSVEGDPMVLAQDWVREQGLVSFAGHPLVVEGRMVGVWAMFARHALSAATLESMASVACGIAVGIERTKALARLAREREWLQVTLASIGDGVIAADLDGQVRFLNPIAEAITGWSRAEAVGKPIERVFHVVDELTREPIEDPFTRVAREGEAVGLPSHAVVLGRDGSETPIDDSAAPIRDAGGRVAGVVIVFQAATERRRYEESLRRGEERYRALVEAFSQIVWRTDPDGLIIDDSPSWRAFTGQTFEQWEGAGWLDAIHPDDREHAVEVWRQAVASRQFYQVEYRLMRADGEYRWTVARGVPIHGPEGAVREWVGTNTDVTERKLHEVELRAAKEEAEHANQAKTQFLAVLSHELRTPLNPILLAVTSMLERPADPEDVRDNLKMIRQNVHLQSRLIDDLLDVTRIVRGKMPLHWEVVDAHVLIGHSIGICRSEVFGKELKLTLDLAAPRHHINADPVRLQQVFWNLIKNAVKFTGPGGSIALSTRNQADSTGEDHLIIEVADTGIGIEPEVVGRIFDPFQQGETSITRRFGGLGLGLAISKGIIEGHGGSLVAESAGKDQGTTFRIELQALPDPRPLEPGEPAAGSDLARPTAVRPLKILLVEDEQATSRLMARLLRGLGHEVTTAGTIAEASDKEREGEFTLIVSDIGLPDGSGLELMKRVIARRGPIPAIALTGYGMEEDIRRSREAGFVAHMTKPIDFTKLEAMIRQVAT